MMQGVLCIAWFEAAHCTKKKKTPFCICVSHLYYSVCESEFNVHGTAICRDQISVNSTECDLADHAVVFFLHLKVNKIFKAAFVHFSNSVLRRCEKRQ